MKYNSEKIFLNFLNFILFDLQSVSGQLVKLILTSVKAKYLEMFVLKTALNLMRSNFCIPTSIPQNPQSPPKCWTICQFLFFIHWLLQVLFCFFNNSKDQFLRLIFWFRTRSASYSIFEDVSSNRTSSAPF